MIGQVFWPSAVAAEDAEERLRALERRQLVRRSRRSSVAGELEYGFVHALLRDVAYEQIPRAQRMASTSAPPAGSRRWAARRTMPSCSATTTSRRWRYPAPPDATSARPSREARAALAHAGDRARALYAFAAAERFYSDALALWPQDASASAPS